ncbi:hypothetical protein J6590_086908 [Homalodisca vitripennis]|nr:hypothetical protein J6590_086908 [Homalodisca vitripennis]
MRVVQREWRTQLEHKCITSVVQRTVKALHMMHTRRHVTAMTRCGCYDEMRVVQREWRTQLEHKCITSVVQRTVKALHMMHTRRHVTAMTRCGSYRENGELNWNISV